MNTFPSTAPIKRADWQKLCQRLGVRPAGKVGQVEGPTYRTGVRPMDDLLGGGMPCNELSEVIVPHRSSGGSLLLHRLLESAQAAMRYVALIDAGDAFAPDMTQSEVLLRHLYWVRCQGTEVALRVCDILSADQNLSLLLLDIRAADRSLLNRIPGNRWYRLQRAVRKQGATCVVFTSYPSVPAASVRLELLNHFSLSDLERPTDLLAENFQLKSLRGRSEASQQLA